MWNRKSRSSKVSSTFFVHVSTAQNCYSLIACTRNMVGSRYFMENFFFFVILTTNIFLTRTRTNVTEHIVYLTYSFGKVLHNTTDFIVFGVFFKLNFIKMKNTFHYDTVDAVSWDFKGVKIKNHSISLHLVFYHCKSGLCFIVRAVFVCVVRDRFAIVVVL